MAPSTTIASESGFNSIALQENLGREKHTGTTFKEEAPQHKEDATPVQQDDNLTYTDDEHEPEIHARTWIAVAALCVQSFCQLFALMGPPTIVCCLPAILLSM
jgi:hypothetical protein